MTLSAALQAPLNHALAKNEVVIVLEIRKDLKSADELLYRLIIYSKVFKENNINKWSHLKNNEDYRAIYSFDDDKRYPLEKIYGTGRDIAVEMTSELTSFNYADIYPTIKMYIQYFEDGILSQIDDFRQISSRAKSVVSQLELCPWAVSQMIKLFDEQLDYFEPIQNILNLLKKSRLYKMENGEMQMDENDKATYNVSNVSGKVNFFSTDNSTNVSISVDGNLFQNLKETINASDIPEDDKKTILKNVSNLETSVGTKDYIQTYQSLIQSAANHMSIISPFIPALTQLFC